MKKRDIDEFTDEDLAYARSIDFSNGLTVDEMPFIKAYQEKKGIRKPQRKKIISLRLDEDILTSCCRKYTNTCFSMRMISARG